MRWGFVLALIVVMLGLGAWWGYVTTRPNPSPRESALPPKPEKPLKAMEGGTRVQPGCEAIAHSIRAAISRGGAIPVETRLLRVELSEEGQCTIELSSDFSAVNVRGSTGESQAQNALRDALAAFPKVKTLTVIVDGQVFEGSHSGEWDEIPVGSSSSTDVAP